MKKYTHPKKNTAVIISKNGATNEGYVFTTNQFTNTVFDFRTFINNEENTNNTNTFNIFINEYKYTTQNMWFNLNKKNDNN